MIFAFLLSLSVCGPLDAIATEPAARPNILWIVIENVGPDFGCYGAADVATPHLDGFAREAVRFERAFATAPCCSPSRSAFLTGAYQNTIGAHHHSSHFLPGLDAGHTLPPGLRPLPQLMAAAGYATANLERVGDEILGTGKVELNFDVRGPLLRPIRPAGNSPRSRQNAANSARLYEVTQWNDLPTDRPWFAQVNLPTVEKSRGRGWTGSADVPWYGQTHPATTDPASVHLPPYYPDTPRVRKDWAGYVDAVNASDDRVGRLLAELARSPWADSTVVFIFGDNGRLEHRGHGWCYDSGDRVPLLVRWPADVTPPRGYKAGGTVSRVVSLVDLPATTLAIAGVASPRDRNGDVPGEWVSRPLFGPDAAARSFVFSLRDRHDEVPARVRAVRSKRWRYIRNFTPHVTTMTLHRYKEASYPVVPVIRERAAAGQLSGPPLQLMQPQLPREEFYDLEADPFEIRNLAESHDPEVLAAFAEHRDALADWIQETGDEQLPAEPPGVLDWWIEAMDDRFGTPAWASEEPDAPREPAVTE